MAVSKIAMNQPESLFQRIWDSELGITVGSSGLFANTSYYDGKAVFISFEIPAWTPRANEIIVLGTLDSKYRPSQTVSAWGYTTNSSYANIQPISGQILADGSIRAIFNGANNNYTFYFATYLL